MATLPRNIQLFDHIMAVVLVRLYETFPSPEDFRCAPLGAEIGEQVQSGEEEASRMWGIVNDTIVFLHREGFIHVQTPVTYYSDPSEYLGVTLTRRGLAVLGLEASPRSLVDPAQRQTWGVRLKSALEEKSPELIADAIGAVVRSI